MFITVTLNAKLQPMHRHEIEDSINDIFRQQNIQAEITGGGTMQHQNGEIKLCDLEIELKEKEFNNEIINIIEFILAPKGSKITIHAENEDEEPKVIPFGQHEGLGLYLNGSDLDDKVYDECDVNVVYEEIQKLINVNDSGNIESYWEGEETTFYLYGKNFDDMKKIITPFLEKYPLCEKCRVVKIA